MQDYTSILLEQLLQEAYQPVTGKTDAEKEAARKEFWRAAKAGEYSRTNKHPKVSYIDVENFHIAYDDYLVRTGGIKLFNNDGLLIQKNWPEIQAVRANGNGSQDDEYAGMALAKLYGMQFKQGLTTKDGLAAAQQAEAERLAKEKAEKDAEEARIKAFIDEVHAKMADEQKAFENAIPRLAREATAQLDPGIMREFDALTGGKQKLGADDIIIEPKFSCNDTKHSPYFGETPIVQKGAVVRIKLGNRPSNASVAVDQCEDPAEIAGAVEQLAKSAIKFLKEHLSDSLLVTLLDNIAVGFADAVKKRGLWAILLNNRVYVVYGAVGYGTDHLNLATVNSGGTRYWQYDPLDVAEKYEVLTNLKPVPRPKVLAVYENGRSNSGRCYTYHAWDIYFNSNITHDQKVLLNIAEKESFGPFGSKSELSQSTKYADFGLDMLNSNVYEYDSGD